jgi:hypothetical protein
MLVWDIPDELKAAFKTVCARRGMTMQGAAVVLMRIFSRPDFPKKHPIK